ncbi:hypothetical protein Dsin_003291 [Dipteronia sinensis]|uniref:EF-hand domain-containing protein n=1 Tax=Dipteronia sinensis TaxID=43782 RepID=A0AAE0B8V9_9ROSI|nr:hypothetical protein Dsin_003291 [Dipteronia sinensis]
MPSKYTAKEPKVPQNGRKLLEVFKRHDADGDGRLSKAEIKKAFDELGALIPAYRAYRGLNHADGNGDGFVDMNELEDLVQYAENHGYTGST